MKQIALITGASSGIGLELSKLFAQDGYDLVLVARSTRKLETLASELRQAHGAEVTVLTADLSQPRAAMKVFEAVQERGIEIHTLVNNAGFGIHKLLAETDPDEVVQMLQINMVTLTELTCLFLPGMLKRKAGRILNIGSTGSFGPSPYMAAYVASKGYVLTFSEGLAEELRGSGVTVTALCPGVTPTGFQERAQVGNMPLVHYGIVSAEKVAAAGYKALLQGKRRLVPGLANQLLVMSMSLTPRAIMLPLARRFMTK
jgi:short-subunit dehydrogenase